MNELKCRRFLTILSALMFSMCHVYAHASESHTGHHIVLPFKSITPLTATNCSEDELADKCRELGVKIDWLSRYQDRAACTQNLDGAPVYFAGYHLNKKNKATAQTLLEEAMVKINFALEIGCYGQSDMTLLISDIKVLMQAINA